MMRPPAARALSLSLHLPLVLALLSVCARAQTQTSSASSSTREGSATAAETSLVASTTSAVASAAGGASVSGSAVASASASSSSSSGSSDVPMSVSLPPLYECQESTWTYTAPAGPKYLGFWVTGTTSFIETYPLPSAYDSHTNGTFTWECDLPAGLSIAAMFYVIQDGASGTDGHQTSTTDAVINAGSSSDSCLGSNDPGSKSEILSLASSLDPTFVYTSAASSSSGSGSSGANSGSSGGSHTGAIVGGVVGGVVGIALVGALLFYLRRKHDAATRSTADGLSLYSAPRSEKRGSTRYAPGPGSTATGPAAGEGVSPPPPGTYYATDEQGNTILVMGYPPHGGDVEGGYVVHPDPSVLDMSLASAQHPNTPPAVQQQQMGPKVTAAPGMLPEPMDEPTPARPPASSAPSSAPTPALTHADSFHTATAASASPTTAAPSSPHNFTPMSEREGLLLGHHGLDDPSSFSPMRRT
ncbi:hypothetical protein JCM1840_006881 [Sporobolomyces johnsonii]